MEVAGASSFGERSCIRIALTGLLFLVFWHFFVLLIAIVSRTSDLLYFVIRHVIHYLSGSALIIRRVIFVAAD